MNFDGSIGSGWNGVGRSNWAYPTDSEYADWISEYRDDMLFTPFSGWKSIR